MVDMQTTPSRMRMEKVLEVIEKRRKAGERPFVHVLEVVDHMSESDLTDLDIGMAVSRLVRAGKLRYALDGIRIVAQ